MFFYVVGEFCLPVCSEDLDLDCAIVNQVKVRSQAAAAAKPYTIWTWQEKFKKNNQFLGEKRAEK